MSMNDLDKMSILHKTLGLHENQPTNKRETTKRETDLYLFWPAWYETNNIMLPKRETDLNMFLTENALLN